MKTPEQIAEEILRPTYASERGLILVIASAIQAERDRAIAAERDLAEAEKLLEPFARTEHVEAQEWRHYWTADDVRAARAFLDRRKGVK